jgi:hypothetical protein
MSEKYWLVHTHPDVPASHKHLLPRIGYDEPDDAVRKVPEILGVGGDVLRIELDDGSVLLTRDEILKQLRERPDLAGPPRHW